jgi:hypothetical protein
LTQGRDTREMIVLGLMLCYALNRDEAEAVADEHEAKVITSAVWSLGEFTIPQSLRAWWRMGRLESWIDGRDSVGHQLLRRARALRRRSARGLARV